MDINRINSVSISKNSRYISVTLGGIQMRFHAVWLRDNSQHPDTKSAVNGQRLITLLDQPNDLRIASACFVSNKIMEVTFSGEDFSHCFSLQWLLANRYDKPVHEGLGWTNEHIERWGDNLQSALPRGDFDDCQQNPQALQRWLAAIRRYGFALMTGLPEDHEGFLEAVKLFGFVRETNYGKYFEVRAKVEPENLAYTNQGLQAHTDNPYRDPVVTMQVLACLENTAEGGESIVVDGFKVVQQLQQNSAEDFALLSQYCCRFEYKGSEGVVLQSKYPLIQLNADGELIAVRFNNRSAAPFTDIPFDKMEAYYRAYRHFTELVEAPENQLSFKLQPRQLFIVDNCRVLHSRTAFTGEGNRWLRGCYPDRDGLYSTLASLEQRHNGSQQV